MKNNFSPKNHRGQVTVFIIIAIVLVAGVAGYFLFRQGIFQGGVPASIEPVYNNLLSCIEERTATGISILESQAGYIDLPEFEAGSNYMPFSSQLDFLGNPIPYWYYVSGNNIEREQVPSKRNMEIQLENFIEEKIAGCRFEDYFYQGFEIDKGQPDARVSISNSNVQVNLVMDLTIKKGEDSSILRNHKVGVNSNLGKLYASAREVYEKQQEELFLEKYAVDTLRLYSPVDGVELACSPKIWNAETVFTELKDAIETNTIALKNRGNSDDYFLVDLDVAEEIRFINSKNWANSFEVSPTEGNLLIANPVGNQPGLGILGFCYVPYHFVYNAKYPVLVQVSDGAETFQFPIAVVVQGNLPREAMDSSAVEIELPELCRYKNNKLTVNTFNSNLAVVDAEISYECFGTKCSIGETSGGILNGEFPQCVNGYILANAEGFETAKYLYSSISPGSVDIILDRIYEKTVELKIDGRNSAKNAVVTFISDKGSKTIVWPEQKSIALSEEQYEIQVQVYENSSLNLAATTTQECVEVPQSGLGSLLGLTKEKCFDVEVPAQIISNVLSGGGTQNYYVLESELKNSGVVEINAQSLPLPDSIEKLQNNYILFEDKSLEVIFR